MKNISTAFHRSTNAKTAFTLIELLAITAVVLVLMGITFGVTKGVLNQQARSQARAELAMIAQALEEFKLTYGDYPIVAEDDPVGTNANAKALTLALTGFLYLKPGTVEGSREMIEVDNSKSFIDIEKMNLSEDFGAPLTYAQLNEDSFLLDPWREPYVYVYHKGSSVNSWDNISYVLFSKGPDREAELDDTIINTGILDQAHYSEDENKDNIYPNQ